MFVEYRSKDCVELGHERAKGSSWGMKKRRGSDIINKVDYVD
jgi:hypothetical protein